MSSEISTYECICGKGISSKISNARVLVVGAGGIGCEVLKNLVISGFKHIKVIDLDTIEMSNLNRQFLFRKHHIGQPKATVAASVAMEYGDGAEIDAEHANIMNPKFDLYFFKSFNVVFNALDNIKARQYVNSMCILSDVPLIEGGSTGLLGQSYPIIPHQTECYNCRPRGGDEGEKYAVCTIRSTPDKLEHCIVWAKELFVLLFGNANESLLFEEVDSVYMHTLIPDSSAIQSESACVAFCIRMLEALFDAEIDKRVAIGSYITSEQKPVRINVRKMADIDGVIKGKYAEISENYENVWDVKNCVNILLYWIMKYILEGKYNSINVFDKDIHGDIAIVAAASNKIAGNIIPAVASTNAIVAGIQVITAVKILSMAERSRADVSREMRYSYLLKVKNNYNRILQSVTLMAPFSSCLTCSSQTHIIVIMDIKRASFRGFLEEIVKGRLQFEAPMITIGSNLVYEEPEEGEESLMDLKTLYPTVLSELPGDGVHHGSVVEIEDGISNQHASITIYHQSLDDIETKNENGYIILNEDIIPNILKSKDEEVKKDDDDFDDGSDIVEEDDENDCCIEVDTDTISSVKRNKSVDEIDKNSKMERIL